MRKGRVVVTANEKDDHFWTHDLYIESLEHTCLGDAVYELANSMTSSEIRDGETETFHRWSRIKVPDSYADLVAESAAEHVLEMLDGEYAGPDGGDDQPAPAMLEAAGEFVKAVVNEYVPWRCEPDGHTEKVDLLKWCEEHSPELLEDE